MRVISFNEVTNTLRLEPESFDDLYLLARVITVEDKVGAWSYRRFRPSETDIGEQKEVFVILSVEKVEIDRDASRLRVTGKIESGKPQEFVKIRSYHTLNIAPADQIEIVKLEWKSYILKRIKQAVEEAKKPKLGIIAVDDEKATVAYIKGYGIEIVTELYSHLSKRMKEKEYEKTRIAYFNDLINTASRMSVDMVVIAGPGFTKDDIKKYVDERGGIGKQLVFTAASDAERSGIREVMRSDVASKIMEGEHVKKELDYLNKFFIGLRVGKSVYGLDNVGSAIDQGRIGIVIVNDSVLNNSDIKGLLDKVDKENINIEIFNAEDEAGRQLEAFKGVAAMDASILEL